MGNGRSRSRAGSVDAAPAPAPAKAAPSSQTLSAAAKGLLLDALEADPTAALDDRFLCPICQEVLEQPAALPCEHAFCRDCIAMAAAASPTCPMCRAPFAADAPPQPARALQAAMAAETLTCACGRAVALANYRRHAADCAATAAAAAALPVPTFEPVAPTSRPPPAPEPNRATFDCPLCSSARHLTCNALVEHCSSSHRRGRNKRGVCPVCASMPWGDPTMQMDDLPRHLHRRHRFEYDEFVNFQDAAGDEDAILAAVLEQSMYSR